MHTYAVPAAQSPVVHLHRLGEGQLFEHYAAAFERVWESADVAQFVEKVAGRRGWPTRGDVGGPWDLNSQPAG